MGRTVQSTPGQISDIYLRYAEHQGITRQQAKEQILRYAYGMETGPSSPRAFLLSQKECPWTVIVWSFHNKTLVECPMCFPTRESAEAYAKDERTAYADFYSAPAFDGYPKVVPLRQDTEE